MRRHYHSTSRRFQFKTGESLATAGCRALVDLWSLRMLMCIAHDSRVAAILTNLDENVLVRLGIGEVEKTLGQKQLRRRILDALAQQEARAPKLIGPLWNNLGRLRATAGLDVAECRVLAFAVLIRAALSLCEVAAVVGEALDGEAAIMLIAVAIALKPKMVRRALRADGTLARSGLLRLDSGGFYALHLKLDLLQGLHDALLAVESSPLAMLRRYFQEAAPATLDAGDYPHVAADVELLCRYLTAVDKRDTGGVNVLVHGRPGTGKTELARLIAQETGRKLFEISMEDDVGEPVAGRDRFSAYQLCQSVLARRRGECLVLFDEVEDVFPGDTLVFAIGGADTQKKAWVNRVLETNPVPAVWVTNSLDVIDPAHLRRFDYVLELDSPPIEVRRRVLEKHFDRLPVRPPFVRRMAEHPDLLPAHVERAARLVSHLDEPEAAHVEGALERVMGNTLESLGYRRKPIQVAPSVCSYDLGYLNADFDLAAVAAGLAGRSDGRLCLYGPPGTGKTAFARELARLLERPLLAKRASDLLDRYVGGTEARIAAAFREAEAERAVLLFDEADSLLRERSGAHQSWEVTQVNELLVQMETFEGIFVAATNLMNSLDAASLRRFDLRIRFDYLHLAQAEALLRQVLAEHGEKGALDEPMRRRLVRLDTVTPGDFATVVRQIDLLGQTPDPERLIAALEVECAAKAVGSGRGIGFAAVI